MAESQNGLVCENKTDNTDTTTTNMYLSVRTYGQNFDRIDCNSTLGISELGGYSTGAALNEASHLTTVVATYPLSSVTPDSTVSLTSQTIDFTATEVVPIVMSLVWEVPMLTMPSVAPSPPSIVTLPPAP